jgi:DNA-binding NarL/FixJ family response regulator
MTKSSRPATRLLIADDHTLFREGVRALLTSIGTAEVVGEAANGDEAIALVRRLEPDVVLMDIQMPGTNGIDATRAILSRQPEIGVIMLTMFEDDDSVLAGMRAGARGYVLKGADQAELMQAIDIVASGGALFGPSIAHRLIAFFEGGREFPRPFPDLTAREYEVLELIAEGVTNAEIAERLFVSPKTVRNHITNIFAKLQVADRAQAIIRARRAGIGPG